MTFQNETLQIDTPENVIFDYQIAGIGSRFLACTIDTLLIMLIMVFVNFLITLVLREVAFGKIDHIRAWVLALLGLLNFGVFWGYYMLFETIWNGQTPGKVRLGLRVIRGSGTPITVSEVVIRNLVRVVDFLPALYTAGIVAMFIDGQSRRLGDLAANTVVVYDREAIELSSVASSINAKPAALHQPIDHFQDDSLPVRRLSAQEVMMVEEFFRRRFQLSNREAMAHKLLRRMYAQMGVALPPLQEGEAEERLTQVLNAVRGRQGQP